MVDVNVLKEGISRCLDSMSDDIKEKGLLGEEVYD